MKNCFRALLGLSLFFSISASAARPVYLFLGANRSDAEIQEFKKFIESPSGANMDFEYLPKKGKTFTAPDVGDLVGNIIASGRSIQSFSISGHSKGDYFTGSAEDGTARGSIARDDILKLVSDHPQFRNSVRSIFLHGCYTGTTGAFEMWRGMFPNSTFRAGFNSNSNDSWSMRQVKRILRAVIHQAPALVRLADSSQLKSSFKTIIAGQTQVPCTIETGDERCLGFFLDSKGKMINLKEHDQVCPIKFFRSFYKDTDNPDDFDQEHADLFSNYVCYVSVKDSCLDVPGDTHDVPPDHPNLLRRLYTLLQNYNGNTCKRELDRFHIPSSDTVAMLVFNEAVRANFLNYFRNEIQTLKNAGITVPDLSLGHSNRKDWQDFAFALSSQIRSLGSDAEKKAALKVSMGIQNLVIYPSANCPDFKWHEVLPAAALPSVSDSCFE